MVALVAIGSYSYSQVVVAGVSPAAVQGNYDYGVQAACGAWPGETDDGSWGWNLDFNTPGVFVQDTLMMAEDGTLGLNLQGNPISQEACFPLTNDLTGKIAVLYRNTCDFATKAWNAQEAGAVAVIVLNREDDVAIGMSADPLGDGPNVTIPVVIVSNVSGAIMTNAMAGGPVVMLIGNKQNAFVNDLGAVKGEFLVNDFGGANSAIYDGMTPGIQVYNFGSADQAAVTVNATITDGGGTAVYDETVGPLSIVSGDTAFIFPGNTDEFPAWDLGIGSYTNDDYTLTYTLDMGVVDDSDFDNVYMADFKIQDEGLSLSTMDAVNMPIAGGNPSNSTTEYQSCMMFQDPNASALAIAGMYFVPHTDTAVNDLAGAEIFANAYQWDDAWTDLNDAAYTFDPATNDAFQNLNLVTFGTHYPASNDDVDDVAYVEFGTQFQMVDNQRYLFCLQTFESATISFGYDNSIDYGGNYGVLAQPVSPVHVDGSWYAAGWNGSSATSISLHTFDPAIIGVQENDVLEGRAFPNPTNDNVVISLNASGEGTINVTDLAGRTAMNVATTFVNGSVKVDMSSLESGVYVFNVTLENGQTSQFNVVKN